uniref:Uncharacterized protein n=1 Tax=Picea sitchensis TaxID=3332 RepID=B8LNT7_PICSI|nr:unknown [Picea sitchensis]
MGNHLGRAKSSISTTATKVIRWDDGGIEEFKEAIKVGELMVDNPQKFVCDFRDLQAGRRITALRAEEDLALGGVYLLLPMQKYLRCVLSPSDMASINLLSLQCNSGCRKLPCNSRIFPAVCTGNLSDFSSMNDSAERSDQLQVKSTDRFMVPKLELDEDEDWPTRFGFVLSHHKLRGFRSWKPALETISESPRVYKP